MGTGYMDWRVNNSFSLGLDAPLRATTPGQGRHRFFVFEAKWQTVATDVQVAAAPMPCPLP